MAASDITSVQSSNIVGYQLIPVPTGYTLFTPTFEGVGGATIDLTSIAVCDEDGNELDLYNDVNIQKMDDLGGYLDAYGYSPTFGGWNVDFTPIEEGDVTLQPGEAVCVSNDSGDTVYFQLPHPIR